MSLKIAILGAGTIAERHVAAAQAVEISVATVVDQQLERAQALAEVCGGKATTAVENVWNDGSVDAVVIAVPNCFHKPLTVAALQAGKHVLLEKPMAMSVAECDEIIAAAKLAKKAVQIALVHRYTGVGRLAQQLSAAGDLGNIYHAKAHLYQRRGVPGLGGWFTTKAVAGGGALIDLGVHLIDLTLFVTGFPPVTEVSGQTYANFGKRMQDYVYDGMWAGPPNYDGICDVDDAAHALIRCAGGLTIDLNVTWAGNFPEGALPDSQMGFFGDQAGMSFELCGDEILIAKEQERKNVDEIVKVDQGDQGDESLKFAEQMQDFARAIESGEVRGATTGQARNVQSIIDAIYQSSATAAAVRLG